jgi:hypothetical protein
VKILGKLFVHNGAVAGLLKLLKKFPRKYEAKTKQQDKFDQSQRNNLALMRLRIHLSNDLHWTFFSLDKRRTTERRTVINQPLR